MSLTLNGQIHSMVYHDFHINILIKLWKDASIRYVLDGNKYSSFLFVPLKGIVKLYFQILLLNF